MPTPHVIQLPTRSINSSARCPSPKEGKRQAGVLLDQGSELIYTVSTRASETAADLGKGLIAYTWQWAQALLVSATKVLRSRR
jgi:hypothetical protein